MRPARLIAAAGVLSATLATTTPASADSPGQCIEYSALGYCVEWDTAIPGGPGQAGGGRIRGPSPEVVCYWVTISPLGNDPTIYRDFGLDIPPEGVEIVWQEYECSDGSTQFNFRWVIPATPANLASIARGRLVRQLPQPTLGASPPIGAASIVGVPVFVVVTNWTGSISEQECAGGLCVTVTATPSMAFAPGESGTELMQCAGPGARYVPGGPPIADQAGAPDACTHVYTRRTGVSGRPEAWAGSVSVTWTIGWSASSGATGSLPSVTRSTSLPRPVEEVQTVIAGGQTP